MVTCSICGEYFLNREEFQKFECNHQNHSNNDVLDLFSRGQQTIESNYVVIGATESGKSYFIYTLLHLLLEEPPPALKEYMKAVNMNIELIGRDARRQFTRFQTLLLSGKLQKGTLTTDPENNVPLNIIIRTGNGNNQQFIRLTFFDISGELFDPDNQYRNFIREQYRIHKAKGIIYLTSPYDDRKLRKLLPFDIIEGNPRSLSTQIYEALYEAIQENDSHHRGKTKVTVPMAFCVSMFDLLEAHVPEKLRNPYIEMSDMMDARHQFRFDQADFISSEMKSFLSNEENSGLKIETIENLYKTVNYFAISAIGHNNPDDIPKRSVGLDPRGILAPLFWLLARHRVIPTSKDNS